MFGLNKNRRGVMTDDEVYAPRVSTFAHAPRPYGNARPQPVDTKPIQVDATDLRATFYYREGRDQAHQYARVTTPLNFNPTYGSVARTTFVPGAKIGESALVAVPRDRNPGMRPVPGRANQYRPAAQSYGSGSQMQPGSVRTLPPAMAKWMV